MIIEIFGTDDCSFCDKAKELVKELQTCNNIEITLHTYNVEDNPARAFGWIMWTAQTIMVILFGCLSLFFIPIYNKYQK